MLLNCLVCDDGSFWKKFVHLQNKLQCSIYIHKHERFQILNIFSAIEHTPVETENIRWTNSSLKILNQLKIKVKL